MSFRFSKSVRLAVALVVASLATVALEAQVKPSAQIVTADASTPKWDIFVGYSYLSPHGTVSTILPSPYPNVLASYVPINFGEIVSGSYFFNRYLGAQAEVSIHEYGVQTQPSPINTNVGTTGNNDGFTTVSGGVIARYPTPSVTPFAHALFGMDLVDGPYHNLYHWGPGVTVGGGLDLGTPWFHHHLAIRLVQGDYERIHVNFGTNAWGGIADINAIRVSSGLVYRSVPVVAATPLALAATVNPAVVYAGDPVAVSTTADHLNSKLHDTYTWSGPGVTGNGENATVSTAGMAPGSYTVKVQLKEGKQGKEGLKAGETAEAEAVFTVKKFEPPTLSCSANPSTLKPGDNSTITASGVSPQNRPLSYSYSATSGSIVGTGSTATYSSVGAPVGTVTVTCNVSDDKGESASATSSLTILAPYVAPIPHTQSLGAITFTKDKARPARVDNEAKAILDGVALSLQRQPDATLVVVGESTAKEKTPKSKHAKVEDLAAQRAVNAKEYLVTEKGIDTARIRAVAGTIDSQTVEIYLVPSGASFANDVPGTTPVDESVVKPQARKPLATRAHSSKVK